MICAADQVLDFEDVPEIYRKECSSWRARTYLVLKVFLRVFCLLFVSELWLASNPEVIDPNPGEGSIAEKLGLLERVEGFSKFRLFVCPSWQCLPPRDRLWTTSRSLPGLTAAAFSEPMRSLIHNPSRDLQSAPTTSPTKATATALHALNQSCSLEPPPASPASASPRGQQRA